jgi:hypothetical protein
MLVVDKNICGYLCLKLAHKYDFLLFVPSYAHPQGTWAPTGPGPPHYRGFTIIHRHTTLGRSSPHEWSARQPLSDNTQQSQETLMPQRGSNPQSQQTSGWRPTPQTARPLGSAVMRMTKNMSTFGFHGNDMKNSRQKLPYRDKLYNDHPNHMS